MSSGQFKEGLPPIPKNMGPIAGPPYLGILFNWWLFGVLTLQWYLYHISFPNDRRFLKLIVHFIFLLETVQTFFTVADGFHWFVYGYGDVARLDEFFLANFDSPMMSCVIALVVQLVYAWRVYHLSRLKLITTAICLCALSQAVGGLAAGIMHQQAGTIERWQGYSTVFQILWAAGSAAADTLIAGAMTWLLLKSRSWRSNDTNTMITRIVRLTIETNVASATVALVVLFVSAIPHVRPPRGTTFLAPGYVLGKLYSNSFMAMLNNRTVIKKDILRNQLLGVGGDGAPQDRYGHWSEPHRPVIPLPTITVEREQDNTSSGTSTMMSESNMKQGPSKV